MIFVADITRQKYLRKFGFDFSWRIGHDAQTVLPRYAARGIERNANKEPQAALQDTAFGSRELG